MTKESPSLPTREKVIERFEKEIYPASIVERGGRLYFMLRLPDGKRLGILALSGRDSFAPFNGIIEDFGSGSTLLLCAPDDANAETLRQALPNLKPIPLGLTASAGMGDRLGLATPGHVRALHSVLARPGAHPISPIFAQQSMRENARTHRNPLQVLNDATWGTFQAGWRGPVGADADHLKTTAEIDLCAAAGYSFFTIDPGDHVESSADSASKSDLDGLVSALPWGELECSRPDFTRRYAGKKINLEGLAVEISLEDTLRTAAKYGKAVAHVTKMYRHLAAKGVPFELEVSVDETETTTRLVEHYIVASELQRLGVCWVSLAPRYVGRFEKGVDYIGDQTELENYLRAHAAAARLLGPYKLSLHSGSDKFRVYPAAAAACRRLVHLKTAGTSYLEALRVIAATDAGLFRHILRLARERYPEERKTYHVSASLDRVPAPESVSDGDLPWLLGQFDARQVLHVTFGSAQAQFRQEIFANLQANEERYYQTLERHFIRHLEPFT